MQESSFEGVGGLKIFTRAWLPEGTPRGVVVIVHGFNAHSGQYLWVADQFVSNGLAVYALDLRGRGNSEGERFFIDKFADYVNDVATYIDLVKSDAPGLPVFLLGHSAGGVISSVYALDHQSEIDGLISEDFAFQLPAPDFALAVVKGLSYVAPHFHALTLKNEDFSRDQSVVDSMNNDPLIAGESQPLETLAELVRADERLKAEIPQITLPVLILHGTADKAAKPDGSQFFYDNVGSADKTLKLYEGSFHNPLDDIDKETVMADIQNWIDARIPAANETSAVSGI
jgi:alpha-beta hydrolase superfamily lysophospholipase